MASDISVSLGIVDTDYTSKLKAAEVAANKFTTGFSGGLTKTEKAVESLNGKFETLTQVLVGAGIIEFSRSLLESANELNDVSSSLGVTIGRLMEMQTVAAISSGSIDGMTKMLEKLQIAVGDAAAGNDALRGTFQSIGQSGQTLAAASLDIQFYNIAKALAAMGPGAEQAAKANELFGKTARGFDWDSYVKKIEETYGAFTPFGEAQKKAANLSEELNRQMMLTKGAFVEIIQPVIDLITPTGDLSDRMAAAKKTAEVLAGALALFATSATINAFGTIAKAVGSLAGLMSSTVVPTNVATAAIVNQSRALGTFLSGAYARVGSAITTVEVATIRYNAALAANGAESTVTIAAQNALTAATARLAVAEEAAAVAATGAAASIARIDAVAAASIPAMGGASVAATGLGASLVRLSAGTAAALGPLNAFLLLLGSMTAVYQAVWGKDGISNGGGGSNWISDLLGVTDATERATAAQKENNTTTEQSGTIQEAAAAAAAKAATEKAWAQTQLVSGLSNETEKVKATTKAMQDSLSATKERIALQIKNVGLTKEAQDVSLAQFDAEVKAGNDLLKVDQQIADQKEKLKKKGITGEEVAAIRQTISALEDQKKAYTDIEVSAKAITEAELQRNGLLAIQSSFLDAQDKAKQQLMDLDKESAQMTMTDSEKRISNIQYQIKSEQEAALKSFEAARGRKANAEEENEIRNKISASYDGIIAKTNKVIAQSRDFSTGWSKAMNQYVDEATNGAKQAEDLFTKSFKGMEDVLVNFAKTGKFEWKSFAADMLETLLRSQIQQTFANMMNGMKDSTGGLMGAIGSLFGGGSSGSATSQKQDTGIMGAVSSIFGGGSGAKDGTPVFVTNWPGSGVGGAFSAASSLLGSGAGGAGSGSPLSSVITGIGDLFASDNQSTAQYSSGYASRQGFGGSSQQQDSGLTSVLSSLGDGISSFTSGISDFFGGFFAGGGSLPAGKFGIVGEKGPELITGPANITPGSGVSAQGGGVTNVYYTINANDASSFAQMLARDPSLIYALTLQGSKGMKA
jgi:lambda family phage tail tape measure protein